MPLVSDNIPNMINGVSQQPAALRLPSQCQAQQNGLSSVVDGLIKRPPLEFVAKLSATPVNGAFVHTINRDINERYVVVLTNQNVKVYDIEGNAKTVNVSSASYLASSNPRNDFAAVTLADYTFIVNRTKTVKMSNTLSPNSKGYGLIFIKQAVPGSTYKVSLDGSSVATYTAASGDDTRDIAEEIRTQIGQSGANFSVTKNGSSLMLFKSGAADFTLNVEDGYGDRAMIGVKDKVQRFSELTKVAPNNLIVKVIGDNTSSFDNYYVKFTTNNGGNIAEGTWAETVAPDIEYKLDDSTMPHTLVRNADGTFTFNKTTWGERVAGNANSAPNPSFVGSTINDVFLFKNRLGFLTDENVVMSRAGEFFDFFPETVTTVLDSDPIDVAASNVKVSILKHAIPFSEQTILFSDQTQFILTGGDLLTPSTVSITPTTEFEVSDAVKPVAAGRNIYFVTDKGEFSKVREYFVDEGNDTKDAFDITGHVPRYIPKNVSKLAASPNMDILCLLSDDETNAIYIYKYYWSEDEKLQSSWSKWVFDSDCDILNIDFIENYLYVVANYADGLYIERIDVSKQIDTGSKYLTHLDRRITEDQCLSISYDSGTNQTTFTLPYNIPNGASMVIVTRPGGSTPEGVSYNILSQGMNTLVVSGDKSSQPVYIGLPYEFRYRFSHQYVKEQNRNGAISAINMGRLQVRTMTIRYADTAFFNVEVTPKYRNTSTHKFRGRVIGSGNNRVGQVSIESGTITVPVLSKNDEVDIDIVSDSYLPCRFLSAEWEGVYSIRSKRL